MAKPSNDESIANELLSEDEAEQVDPTLLTEDEKASYQSAHDGYHQHDDGSMHTGETIWGIPVRMMVDARPPCTNQIELMWALYSLFRGNFRGIEVNERSYTSNIEVPLATGNTAIISVSIKTPEEMKQYKERGY